MKIKNYKDGMTVQAPCAIRGMPIDVYHKHPALSESGLKTLLDCPARYYYKYLSGDYEPKEKPSFKIGKACHKYILEGEDAFYKEYWHNPYSDLTKTELVRILQDKFNYDCTIKNYPICDLMDMLLTSEGIEQKNIHLNRNELNQVIGTARAIKQNKKAYNAFHQKGESEISLFWIDEETGLMLKCRPDYLPENHLLVPDYKTCQSVNPETFYGDFIKYGYHIEAAMYMAGIKAVFGDDVETFFFVAQEKEEPYITQVYVPDDAIVTYGDKAVRLGIEKFIECQQKGFWGTYSEDVIQMTIEPKPDDLINNYDRENSICYAPYWVDKMILKYEELL